MELTVPMSITWFLFMDSSVLVSPIEFERGRVCAPFGNLMFVGFLFTPFSGFVWKELESLLANSEPNRWPPPRGQSPYYSPQCFLRPILRLFLRRLLWLELGSWVSKLSGLTCLVGPVAVLNQSLVDPPSGTFGSIWYQRSKFGHIFSK